MSCRPNGRGWEHPYPHGWNPEPLARRGILRPTNLPEGTYDGESGIDLTVPAGTTEVLDTGAEACVILLQEAALGIRLLVYDRVVVEEGASVKVSGPIALAIVGLESMEILGVIDGAAEGSIDGPGGPAPAGAGGVGKMVQDGEGAADSARPAVVEAGAPTPSTPMREALVAPRKAPRRRARCWEAVVVPGPRTTQPFDFETAVVGQPGPDGSPILTTSNGASTTTRCSRVRRWQPSPPSSSGSRRRRRTYRALAPVVAGFKEAAEDVRVEFRKTLNDYVRLFVFLSQVIAQQVGCLHV